MPKKKKKTTDKDLASNKGSFDSENQKKQDFVRGAEKKLREIKQKNIGTIPEEEKRTIQLISEELREKNLGYYDFKNMVCRIHKIPLIKYKIKEDQDSEPFPMHCSKCIPIPGNWIALSED